MAEDFDEKGRAVGRRRNFCGEWLGFVSERVLRRSMGDDKIALVAARDAVIEIEKTTCCVSECNVVY